MRRRRRRHWHYPDNHPVRLSSHPLLTGSGLVYLFGLVLLCVDVHRFIFRDLPGDILAAPESALCGWIGVGALTPLSLSLSVYLLSDGGGGLPARFGFHGGRCATWARALIAVHAPRRCPCAAGRAAGLRAASSQAAPLSHSWLGSSALCPRSAVLAGPSAAEPCRGVLDRLGSQLRSWDTRTLRGSSRAGARSGLPVFPPSSALPAQPAEVEAD